MKFVYKIHSNFDGFYPARLQERLIDGRLRLGWNRYIDEVEDGSEVWVYFHGRHKFTNGVYLQGVVDEIDVANAIVWIRPRRSSSTNPLSDTADAERLSETVATRYRQVFLLPGELDPTPECSRTAVPPASCGKRSCWRCDSWKSLPAIDRNALIKPDKLAIPAISEFVPAYWAIPSRSFIYHGGREIAPGIRQTHEMFKRFKVGEAALAYPLALGVYQALRALGWDGVDAIVPIPLSPDKLSAGEIHRTRLLAKELAALMSRPVVEALSLTHAISKKRYVNSGLSIEKFEADYAAYLSVDAARLHGTRSALLVDDVCTGGSTLGIAAGALRSRLPTLEIVAATAAQMIVRPAVAREDTLLVPRAPGV